MFTILMIVHILVAIALVSLVLLQRGKGADMGAAFGSGASSTVFGSQGSASFLTRTTAALATIFFVTSLSLAYLSGKQTQDVKSATDIAAPLEGGVSPGAMTPAPVTTTATVQDVPVAGKTPSSDVPSIPGGKQ